MSALDLGPTQSDGLRQVIDPKLEAYGIDVRGVAFTRVTLPAALTDSLEARRLASLQLAEQAESLRARQAAPRRPGRPRRPGGRVPADRGGVRGRGRGRCAWRSWRSGSGPTRTPPATTSSRRRLRVAEQLAGNSRAVVSLGGGDLFANLLLARETDGGAGPAAVAGRRSAAGPRRACRPRQRRPRACRERGSPEGLTSGAPVGLGGPAPGLSCSGTTSLSSS